MESVQGNESLFSDLVVSKDLFQCVSFTVAQSLSNEVMFLTVQVKGPTHEFRKRSTVLIKNNESLIFVQTDKPIYKAGQTEPALGFYKVVMRTETGRTVEHPFSVEEFDGKGNPIPHETILIEANEANYHINATTDKNGLVQFSIDTRGVMGASLTIRAKYKDNHICYGFRWLTGENVEARYTANAVFSPSKSFVRLEPVATKLSCDTTLQVQTHYILNGEAVQELKELIFHYLIMSKGGIIRSGTHELPVVQGETKGHFSILISVDPDLAPVARLLLYIILPDGEVVADTVKYEIGDCLFNKVNMSFSTKKGLPGTRTFLSVTASPHSLCALRAVDQSVPLTKPEAELSASLVYDLLPVKDLTGFPEGADLEEEDSKDCIKKNSLYVNGILYSPVLHTNEADMYGLLKDMGLKVFTNSDIRKPKVCGQNKGGKRVPAAYRFLSQSPMEDFLEASQSPMETIRKYFPETWIWDLVVLDSTGRGEKEVITPGAITEWKAGAFCLSNDTGLGLSPVVSFRAFQPFFVTLTMPYSVIRGETFTLKATVLNFLRKCIRVAVHLEASPNYLTAPMERRQRSHCICMKQRQTVSWIVTPKTLGYVSFIVSTEALNSQELCGNEVPKVPETGKKDTIIKSLLVEAEGLENEVTINSLHCPMGAEESEQINLKLPPDVVMESVQASVTVLGDILGSAMQNTQNLLNMPYGCGEQNMVLFAPIVYILDYLNKTRQLTQEIKNKAVDYLSMGYQRQLNYKYQDGSYSTFGDKPGGNTANTWLTAFVLKSFAQARKYIFIQEAHITQALLWLTHQQKDNGCFRSSGSLLNNHNVIRNALFCLDTAWKSRKEGAHDNHVYTKALLAYAFALAGDHAMRKEILKSLDGESVKEDTSIHWTKCQKPTVPVSVWHQPQASSVEIEMTAYVLLAYLTNQPAPTKEDLTAAMLIVKWLIKQQNSLGGFSSTQDTAVALHALSKYASVTFVRTKKAADVTIYSLDSFSAKFQVNNDNKLLLQNVKLPAVPGDYTAIVSGKGCVYLQTSLKYNVIPEEMAFPFALVVQTLPQNCNDRKAHTSFQISLNISYTGSRPASNMVIVDVKMVSGFIPLKLTLKTFESSMYVSRTDINNNHVFIYLEKVSNQTINLTFTVKQDIPVRELKPAIVKVYDYYEKEKLLLGWLQRGWTQTLVLVDFDIIDTLETDIVDLTSK
ncbi:alpha-2-macroglobulin [Cricetulus griseus]